MNWLQLVEDDDGYDTKPGKSFPYGAERPNTKTIQI